MCCIGVANEVENELLSLGFSGILALAFPLNSQIAEVIPPNNGNTPDGAPALSNVFGLGNYGPREHFISVLLERPGISRVPSILGIGRHPTHLLPNISLFGNSWESALQFSKVVEYQAGTLFWSISVTGLTAYVNGTSVDIEIGQSSADVNAVNPIGILDTGTPFIFARVDVVNAFYGTYGFGPASDGLCESRPSESTCRDLSAILHNSIDYVPCSTMINMTISLGGETFSIHPLDVTYVSKDAQNSDYCISAFQASASLTYADL